MQTRFGLFSEAYLDKQWMQKPDSFFCKQIACQNLDLLWIFSIQSGMTSMFWLATGSFKNIIALVYQMGPTILGTVNMKSWTGKNKIQNNFLFRVSFLQQKKVSVEPVWPFLKMKW